MTIFHFPITYLLWHYVYAWADILRLYWNFSWFLWNFFSIPLLLGTLFSPWKRLHEVKTKATAGALGSFIINTILRFVGFIARLATIVVGLAALTMLLVLAVAFIVLWPLMPFMAVFFTIMGIVALFSF